MQMLTKEIEARLPPLGAQEEVADPIVHVKFFQPWGGWTWYATEGSPEGDDWVFFGWVDGLEWEAGNFTLN